jgi:hypothetical protein
MTRTASMRLPGRIFGASEGNRKSQSFPGRRDLPNTKVHGFQSKADKNSVGVILLNRVRLA